MIPAMTQARRDTWLFWLFAHVYFLIGFRNRLVVLMDWASAYWSFQRYARVVTNISPPTTPDAIEVPHVKPRPD